MENPEAKVTPEHQDSEPGGAEAWVRQNVHRIVFAVVSVSFLLYLAFGTVEARIWRFGRLYFEDRGIRHVWGYLGDHLPDMPGQSIVSALYWISLVVMVVGAIAGLWLFLGTDDDDPASDVVTTRAVTTHPEHAVHDA